MATKNSHFMIGGRSLETAFTSLRLKNIKAFRDSGEMTCRPLTLLIGRNSSGKSSIINSLLILRQSLLQQAIGSRVPTLNLNGRDYQAGEYIDLVHNSDTSTSVEFQFSGLIESRNDLGMPQRIVDFDIPRIADRHQLYGSWYFAAPNRYSGQKFVVKLRYAADEPFGPSLSGLEIRLGNQAMSLTKSTRGARRQHWRSHSVQLPSRAFEPVFPPFEFIPWIALKDPSLTRISRANRAGVRAFHEMANHSLGRVRQYIAGFHVLGPFRNAPQRKYTFSGFGAMDTGGSGERAVDLLVMEGLLRTSRQEHALQALVSKWLKRLGVASAIEVRSLGKRANLFELAVAETGRSARVNFADTGFGVSQVLPVIVQGLLTPVGDTYVVQQPELHLHPDAQAGLADFFIFLVESGINCIIETHSEYLLLRLRRRFAELAQNNKHIKSLSRDRKRAITPADVSLLIVDRDNKNGESKVKCSQLQDDFHFSDLPESFMSQSLLDRVALMKASSPNG